MKDKAVVVSGGKIWNKDKCIESAQPTQKTLDELQKRCSVRCISPVNIGDALYECENFIRKISTVKDAIGTKVVIDCNAQCFPRAYKYVPESTIFSAERTVKGWKILDIFRDKTHSYNSAVRFTFTPETIAHMANMLSAMDSTFLG